MGLHLLSIHLKVMSIKEIYLHPSQDGCGGGVKEGGANCSVALITNRWENSLKREVSQALSTDILARIGPVIIYSLHRI